MFSHCESLKSLPDISNWNITNVNNLNGMFYMFYDCSSLKLLQPILKDKIKKKFNQEIF